MLAVMDLTYLSPFLHPKQVADKRITKWSVGKKTGIFDNTLKGS